MAVVLGVFDADSQRRASMRDRLPASLSGLPNTRRHRAQCSALDIYLDASASTPVSVAKDRLAQHERMACVVGDFDASYTLNSDAAARLLRSTADTWPDRSVASGQNGYYLAVVFGDDIGIALGTDALGMFPLYIWSNDDVCLFGTSPELFKTHPSFHAEPSLAGIASVLLISHISGGHSLFKGVRRCSPGHLVTWSPDRGIRQARANSIVMTDTSFDLSHDACVSKVGSIFDNFHRSLSSLASVDISMSGGQDSRMVAGYVGRHLAPKAVQAVSIGNRGDDELRYALKVSAEMGWPHRHQDAEFDQWLNLARDQLRLESLQGPLASLEVGTQRKLLLERGAPFLSGYLGDIVLGDRHTRAAQSEKTGQFEFGELFRKLNAYGFTAEETVDLLATPEGREVLSGVVDSMRQEWSGIEGLPFQKAWLFQLTNRQRFHIGSLIWRLSLGAWPLLPYLDRSLLDAMASMPLAAFRDRRIQADLIRREFPKLATLPLDRNAHAPDYLVRTRYRKIISALPSVADVSWRLHQWLQRGQERRYYVRIFDFNNPGWKLVRQEADTKRNQASGILKVDAVNQLLPLADVNIELGAKPVVEASKTKTLAGLVLWVGENFGREPPEGSDAQVDRNRELTASTLAIK